MTPKSSQMSTDSSTAQITEVENDALERRKFLKKIGKYSAVTSIATVTLMTASKVSALSPPPPPNPDEENWG